MNTLERLKQLEALLRERNEDSVPIYAMAEAWKALPKLLAVVEAHKAFVAYCEDRFTWSAKPHEWEYMTDERELKDAKDALAALSSRGKSSSSK